MRQVVRAALLDLPNGRKHLRRAELSERPRADIGKEIRLQPADHVSRVRLNSRMHLLSVPLARDRLETVRSAALGLALVRLALRGGVDTVCQQLARVIAPIAGLGQRNIGKDAKR